MSADLIENIKKDIAFIESKYERDFMMTSDMCPVVANMKKAISALEAGPFQALKDIVYRYEFSSELHVSDAQCAAALYHTAKHALKYLPAPPKGEQEE